MLDTLIKDFLVLLEKFIKANRRLIRGIERYKKGKSWHSKPVMIEYM